MNVLLIIPQISSKCDREIKSNFYFPLGIAYISSFLKKSNIPVFNFNGALYEKDVCKKKIEKIIKKNKIDIVGIGGLTGEYSNIKFFSEYIRRKFPNITIVLGGGFITSQPDIAMRLVKEADIGIIGEGEVTFVELIKCIKEKLDYSNVNNIIFRHFNELIKTKRLNNLTDIDGLPFPDYEGFEFEKIINKNEEYLKKRIAPVIASRSCPFRCTFCFHPSGDSYRKRSLSDLINEIKWLKKIYNINYISIIDELFILDINYLKRFTSFMVQNEIDWDCCARIDMVNETILQILKKGRCVQIFYGLESADDIVLSSMKKNINHAIISKKLDLTKKIGIRFRGAFIFGDKAETTSTILNSIDYYLEHKNYAIDLNLLRIFPGTEIYKYAVKKGIIINEEEYVKKGCPYINVSGLSNSEYSKLKYLIESAKAKKVNAPIGFNKLKKNNNKQYQVVCKCRVCRYNNLVYFDRISAQIDFFCKSCNEYYCFSITKFFSEKINDVVLRYKKTYKKIILYSVNYESLSLYQIIENKDDISFFDNRYLDIDLPLIEYDAINDKENLIVLCSDFLQAEECENMVYIDNVLEESVLYE